MQKLRPIKVPWQVSPSTPCLRLFASETSEEHTQVTFSAHFALREKPTKINQIGFESAAIESNPYLSESKKTDSHSLVKVEFNRGLWSRLSPAFSDREVLNPAEFDDSLLSGSSPQVDVQRWLADFQSSWIKTGYCPDPGIYLVEESDWCQRVSSKLNHYLIEGHDSYVEVLAEGYSWREE